MPEIPKIFGQRKQALKESCSSNNKHVSHVIDSAILLSITKISTLTEQNFRFYNYRSGTVNSKSFVGKVLLRIKRKFELN